MTETAERTVVDGVEKRLFIGGEWRDATGGETLIVEDPSTAEPLAEVADATPDDAMAALGAAHGVQAEWRNYPPRERGEILRRAFEKIVSRTDELALLMTLEMGKSLAESRAEVAYAAEFFRWFSEEAARIEGRYAVPPAGAGRMLTMKQPVGPCILITPWNFPMAMGTRKIGPAVAAGCTMVVKPAEQTPLCMLALAQILEESGLPGGVLNVITSSSSGPVMAPLISDPRARKLSFTGSTEVGRKLIGQSAEQILRVSMELGGNAPFIVFDDADLDAAVDGAVLAKFRNTGQSCIGANRFFVQARVHEEFAHRFAERVDAMTLGDGLADPVPDLGPVIDDARAAAVSGMVDEALTAGARLLTREFDLPPGGSFAAPALLTDVPSSCALAHEEVFGPVAAVFPFDDEEEVLTRANATEMGLAGYFYSRDASRSWRLAEHLETGIVGINNPLPAVVFAPMGGVKQSGLGREGAEGLEEFEDVRYLSVGV